MSDSTAPVRRALVSRWSALFGLIAALLLAVPTAGVAAPGAVNTIAAQHADRPADQHQGQQQPTNANSFGDQPFLTRPAAPTSVLLSSRGGSRLIQPVPVAALPVAGAGQRTDRGWRASEIAETPAGVSGRTERGRGPPRQPR